MDAVEVCERLGQHYVKHSEYCITHCYNTAAHKQGDRRPSLTVYDGDRGYFCFACGESGSHSWLFRQFGIKVEGVTDVYKPKSYSPVQSDDYTSEPKKFKQYPHLKETWQELAEIPKKYHKALESKGWTVGDFQNTAGWRYHTNQIRKWGQGVFIPYFDMDGETIISARLRLFNDEGPRFLGLPRGEMFPYMWHQLTSNEVLFVTEGETDCLTLMFCGIPAVGIPGSTNAGVIDKLIKEAARYKRRLIAVPDSDEAGHKFLERLRISAFQHFVRIDDTTVPYPYKDVNDFYVNSDKELFTKFFTDQLADGLPEPVKIVAPIINQQEKLL